MKKGHYDTIKFLLSLKVNEATTNSPSHKSKKSLGQDLQRQIHAKNKPDYVKNEIHFLNISAVDRFGTTPLQNALDGKKCFFLHCLQYLKFLFFTHTFVFYSCKMLSL